MDDCEICAQHAAEVDPYVLRGACASVGIEHGLTTDEAVVEYWAGFHRRHSRVDC